MLELLSALYGLSAPPVDLNGAERPPYPPR